MRNTRKRKTERTKLASIRPYKKFIATHKNILLYNFLVYAASASHRATLQQFIKFISFNWKSLTLHSHILENVLSHDDDDDDDDIVSDCCSFSNALFLLLWQLSRKQNEREQKLVDENYISMTEINFKFYSALLPH